MLRDVREAVGALRRAPAFTLVVVLTIALAVGAGTALYSMVSGILLRPLPYHEPSRLVQVWESNPAQAQEESPTSLATYVDWRERSRSLESIGAYELRSVTLTGEGDPARVTSAAATPDLFRALGVAPLRGRGLVSGDEVPGSENRAVLSHAGWAGRFGSDPEIVGRSIVLDGQGYEVLGVMPPGFVFPPGSPDVEIWTPLTISLEELPSRPHRSYEAVARMAPGVSLDQARGEMAQIGEGIARENPDSNEGWTVRVVPLHEQLVGSTRSTLWVLFGAVMLVFLIGCVNVSNLLAVRGLESSRAFAVRAALGAGRLDLMRRSVAESVVFAALGGALGLGVASVGVRILVSVTPASVPRVHEVTLDWGVVGFALALTGFAAIFAGLVPAMRAATPQLSELLQDGSRSGSGGRTARRMGGILVAGEVALVLVLVVGAGLMLRSFARLTSVDPGFETQGILSVAVSLPPSRYGGFDRQAQFYSALAERVASLPGVESSGGVSALPLSEVGSEFKMPFTVEGLEATSPTERPQGDYRAVMPGYFATLGIPVLEGRAFDAVDGTDGREVTIVNRSLADRYFPARSAVGQVLTMPMAGSLEVVGVVDDVRHGGFASEPQPELFVPAAQLPLAEMHVVVRASSVDDGLIRGIREAILSLDPELPPTQIATMDQLVSRSVAEPRFNLVLLSGLALVALVLAAVGVFGVVSYSVARRTGEIGLRMALGAEPAAAMRLVLAQTLRIVSLGAVLGLAGAAFLSRFLDSLLFGVTPQDPATYVGGAVLGIAIGLLASLPPAIRASRMDPVEALRTD
jgi:putative ABC transport system permease protein